MEILRNSIRFETGLPANHQFERLREALDQTLSEVASTDASLGLMMTDTSNIYNDESLSPFSTLQPNGVIQLIDTQNNSDPHHQSPPPAVINDSTKPRIYCLNTQRTY